MTVIITGADIYSESDPQHAVAQVTRAGGDRYKVTLPDGKPLAKLGDDKYFATYEGAVAAAGDYAAAFDASPDGEKAAAAYVAQLKDDKIREQAAKLKEHEALIASLQAQVAAPTT